MAAERFGGRFSPQPRPSAAEAPRTSAFRHRRARRVSIRARSLFVLPLPLLFAGLGAVGRGSAVEMLAELGGFAALMLSAWLLNEGMRAEEAYAARSVAKPPAIPRKLFAAVLTALAIVGIGLFSLGHGLFGAVAFGGLAGLAHVASFGLDPMRRKGMDDAAGDRIARALDEAEQMVREIATAAARIGDGGLERRVERLCDQAREVFRTVEADPRDLSRARRFLNVYLLGLRDATAKFAGLYGRSRDPEARAQYEALLGDLETSFAAQRDSLLIENRSDLDVEIEVLRDRLRHDGLTAR